MTEPGSLHDKAVQNRRERLRQWISERYSGSQAAFIASTNDGKTQINQGELSGLLNKKSFGEKRARRLEQQARMPAGYLDLPLAQQEETRMYAVQEPAPAAAPIPLRPPPSSWPFQLVSSDRIEALRRQLGPKKGQEAIRDIDKYLDVLVSKWEQEASGAKRRAGPP